MNRTQQRIARINGIHLTEARALTPKQQAKADDKRIEAAYYRACNGVQINIMDISKVFNAGKAALAAGADEAGLEAAIVAFVATIRQN